MKHIIKILIITHSFNSIAQDDWNWESWYKEGLSFGCGGSATMSIPAYDMTHLLIEKRIDEIRQVLNSDLPAEQYLATFVLDKLNNKKELVIQDTELKRMQEIKQSTQLVQVCAGSGYRTHVSLNILLETKPKHIIYEIAEGWFNTYYKIYYKKKKRNN